MASFRINSCGHSLAWLALALLAAGCSSQPSAPVLEDGPVFRESREGFRFFVPAGWKQWARGGIPSGTVVSERLLVEYKCMTCTDAGALLVTAADVPASTSLSEYLAKNTLTGEDSALDGPAQEFELNRVPAARILYKKNAGKDASIREIVAFRRGERVYFFKGFYTSSDAKSQKAIKTALDTIVW